MNTFYKRVRDSKDISKESRLRLTKNHIQYICDSYVNNIVAPNPGVGFEPKNEREPHDQKAAELHHSVWRDAVERYTIDDKIDDWADSFVQIGEVAVKIYFEPNSGPIKAYEQKSSVDGQPLFLGPDGVETTDGHTPLGEELSPAPDPEKPIHTGEFCFEEVYGFNLLRPPECKDMREAAWLGIRKMVSRKKLKAQFPDKDKFINTSTDKTYKIFDSAQGGYSNSKEEVLVIEYYFKPCHEYPKGYYYITTLDGILAEGELPGGLFPIKFAAFKKFPTTPRGRSPIKTMRPYQAEINRAASKIAEHQITLGDDKLLIQDGTKISAGVSLPGVRSVGFSGMEPKILAGRDGSQYLAYMQAQIVEMYQVMMLAETNADEGGQLDPYVMLFRSARQKKKFQRNIKRFEKFLLEIVKLYIGLAKVHLTDDQFIYAAGAQERVNIAEFRELPETCYEVNIEAQADDIETKLGKQIVINHALQYVGNQLKPEDIGKLMRQMPYANFDESFGDFTIDYDNSTNDILALDRGERPPINTYDNHPYCIQRLTTRMRQADFKFLDPAIQQAYAEKVMLHEQFEAGKQIQIQQAKSGYIPTGGYLAKCDLYIPDPKDPNKSSRVTLPSESVQWLIKQLQSQQAGMAPLANLPQGAQAQIAGLMTQAGPGENPGGNSLSPQAAINIEADRSQGNAILPG